VYIPRHWHWLGPVATVLGGFLIRTQYGAHWDVFAFVQLPLAVIAGEWGAYIWQAGSAYQNYITNASDPNPSPVRTGQILDWNTGKPVDPPSVVPFNDNGRKSVIALNQTVTMPKLDPERRFARTLIDMRNGNLKVDLTEAFWIENGNRYGAEREAFVSMRDRWRKNAVIEKVGQGRTSPYQVIDWRKVRMVAGGTPLPLQ
jgi:hypothetical protein